MSSNYWFVEVMIYILLTMIALLSVPAIDRAERRAPFGFALGLLLFGIAVRFDVLGLRSGLGLSTAVVAFWIFTLGWAAAKAGTTARRLLLTAAVAITVPGFFGSGAPLRETIIITGVALLIWIPAVPSLAMVNRLAGLLAGSSLYIYVVHWQVYPLVSGRSELLALLVSLAAGIGFGAVLRRIPRRAGWGSTSGGWCRLPRACAGRELPARAFRD